MNIILFLFITIAGMLIAGSVNMLYTTTTALEHFKEISNTADNIIITFSNEEADRQMEKWLNGNSKIEDFHWDDMLPLIQDNITAPDGHKKFESIETLALAKIPPKTNLVFNQDNELFTLNPGEIALPVLLQNAMEIQTGDVIKIKAGDISKEFTVRYFIKDVVFGASLMSFKRLIINEEDFDDFSRAGNNNVMKLWSVMKNSDVTYEDVEKEFSKTSIPTIATFSKKVISNAYIMDLVSSAIMIIVSIFLILISFLILRFTIVFTIEEEYRQIGIMKAIGLKNGGIQRIYMVKYLSLAILGGTIGYVGSIPFSAFLMDNISKSIMMQAVFLNYILAAASVILVILFIILFCYLCTRRIGRMSAIDAIRQGGNGERFSVSRKLKLHKMRHISSPLFLASSDLISGFRKFAILIITFILGTIIIIVPINVINTLGSNDVATLFGRGKSDFVIRPESYGMKYKESGVDQLLSDVKAIEEKINSESIKVNIHPEISYMSKIYADDPDYNKNMLSEQSYNYSTDHYPYLKGTPPKLANEVALTEVAADYFGIGIGDTVNCIAKDSTEPLIVTAIYQSMNNMGYAIRFTDAYKSDIKESNGFLIYGTFTGDAGNKKELIKVMKEKFPELEIQSIETYINSIMGGVIEQFGIIRNLLLVIVLGINFLITCLLAKMLLSKELPEVAILKAIGFKDKDIRKWQAARIAMILTASVVLGTITANLTGNFLTAGVFNFMGATRVQLKIEPFQVLFLCPLLMLVVTMTAVLVSLGPVRKTNIWEINNQE